MHAFQYLVSFMFIAFVITTNAQISRPTQYIPQPFDVLEYDVSMDLLSSPLPKLENGHA